MGKESEKEWIFLCVELNHFSIYLKLRQHYKPTILQYEINFKKINLKKSCKANEYLKSQYLSWRETTEK